MGHPVLIRHPGKVRSNLITLRETSWYDVGPRYYRGLFISTSTMGQG